MPRYFGVFTVAVTLTLAGCRVGPDYRRPELQFEQSWIQGEDPRVRVEPSGTVIDNNAWWKTSNDSVLDKLIETAFEQNYSLHLRGDVLMMDVGPKTRHDSVSTCAMRSRRW